MRRSVVSSLLMVGLSLPVVAQAAPVVELVKDLNTASQPLVAVAMHDLKVDGARARFRCNFGGYPNGQEWVSDGTEAGTYPYDRTPDDYDAASPLTYPTSRTTTAGGNAYSFERAASAAGYSLYFTTAGGTRTLVASTSLSDVPIYAVLGEMLVFFGSGGLWRSDGSAGGTVLIKAIADNPRDIVTFEGAVYLGTDSGFYRTDGTAPGTSTIGSSIGAWKLTPFGGRLYLAARPGTSFSTAIAYLTGTNINYVRPSGSSSFLLQSKDFASKLQLPFDGKLYVLADETDAASPTHPTLWAIDGAGAITNVVSDAQITMGGPRLGLDFNRGLQVVGTSLASFMGGQLWLVPAGGGAAVNGLYYGDATVLKTAPLNNGVVAFYRSTTMPQPTLAYATLAGGRNLSFTTTVAAMATASDKVWIMGDGFITSFDGTTLAMPLNVGKSSAARTGDTDVQMVTRLRERVAFNGGDGSFLTDGLASGTANVSGLQLAWFDSSAAPYAVQNAGPVYFLSRYDAGTFTPGVSIPTFDGSTGSVSLGTKVIARGFTGNAGVEPAVIDGDTFTMLDLQAGGNSSSPFAFTKMRDRAYFFTATPAALQQSDGTLSGTTVVSGLPTGTVASTMVAGDALWFALKRTADNSNQIYTSDGTAPGTRAIDGTTVTRTVHALTPFKGGLAYATTAFDGSDSDVRFVSAMGTVQTLAQGRATSLLKAVASSTTLFFQLCTATSGCELWSSEGTPATTRVIDLRPGVASSLALPSDLAIFNGRVYFNANAGGANGGAGFELWSSDGTALGTSLVSDIAPGYFASNPAFLTPLGDKLLFVADDTVHGREWMSLRDDGTGMPGGPGSSGTAGTPGSSGTSGANGSPGNGSSSGSGSPGSDMSGGSAGATPGGNAGGEGGGCAVVGTASDGALSGVAVATALATAFGAWRRRRVTRSESR